MSCIFLCHASEDKDTAEPIKLALANAGYKVFYDKNSLPPGGDYDARIQAAINDSDLFVFLISKDSLSSGKYTLTELKFAEEKWPGPANKVLPVNIGDIEKKNIPNYLLSTTILTPSGNKAAEVRKAIQDLLNISRGRHRALIIATVGFLAIFSTLSYLNYSSSWREESGKFNKEDEVLNRSLGRIEENSRSIDKIVISETGTNIDQDINKLVTYLEKEGLGYHYIIDREGHYYPFVDLTQVTQHTAGYNISSVGIGMAHMQDEVYSDKQISGLTKLLGYLAHRLSIPVNKIVSKETLQPRLKRDITELMPQIREMLTISDDTDSDELNSNASMNIVFTASLPFELSEINIIAIKAYLKSMDIKPESNIVISGHAADIDVKSPGNLGRVSREDALAIGQRRADAVRDYLISNGIDPVKIETISYGRERPLLDDRDESAWKSNRRVELFAQ